jgi:RNA polymerase sigma factor (sigma-70 family)
MASASGESASVARSLGTLFGTGTAAGLSDAQLLERFASGADGGASFEALLTRHGPMVLGVCRDILRDQHAAEDAFQATFLVLVRRAGAVRVQDSLGRWLYGVALRVATRARCDSVKLRSREVPGLEVDPAGCDRSDPDDLRGVIQEELARLPEGQRAAVVLCHLEGLTHDEAARQLRWPVGTVRSRLARARDRLRERLTRRGVAPAVLLPGLWPGYGGLPEALKRTTLHAALKVAAGRAVTAGVVSASVASLTDGVLSTMLLTKLKWTAATVLAAGGMMTSAGVAVLARQDAPRPAAAAPAPVATPAPVAAPTPAPAPAALPAPAPEAPPATIPAPASAPPIQATPPPTAPPAASLPSAPNTPLPPPAQSAPTDPFAAAYPNGLERTTPLMTSTTTSAQVLATRLKIARDKLAWAERMQRIGYVSDTGLAEARLAVELIEAQIQGLREDFRDQLDLLVVQLEGRKSELWAAQARHEQNKQSMELLRKLSERGTVSSLELGKSESEAIERQADVQGRRSAISELELRIKQTQRRLNAIEEVTRRLSADPREDAPPLPTPANAPLPTPSAEAPRPAPPAEAPRVVPLPPTTEDPFARAAHVLPEVAPPQPRSNPDGTVPIAYPVGDLLYPAAPRAEEPVNAEEFQPLIELIQTTVAPDTWKNKDGKGFGSITPFMLNKSLIVRHTPEVHEQVVAFLRRLRRLPAFAILPDQLRKRAETPLVPGLGRDPATVPSVESPPQP